MYFDNNVLLSTSKSTGVQYNLKSDSHEEKENDILKQYFFSHFMISSKTKTFVNLQQSSSSTWSLSLLSIPSPGVIIGQGLTV